MLYENQSKQYMDFSSLDSFTCSQNEDVLKHQLHKIAQASDTMKVIKLKLFFLV